MLQIRQVRLKTIVGFSNEEGTGDLDKQILWSEEGKILIGTDLREMGGEA